MKKVLIVVMVMLLAVSVFIGCGQGGGSGAETPASEAPAADAPASQAPASEAPASEAPAASGGASIGSAIYKYDDTFMTGVRTAMEAKAAEISANLELVDSQNKQPTQNEQVDTFITKGVQALTINPVDRTAAAPIIDKAKAAGLPVVFFNREPEATDLKSYDKTWYVGAKAEQSGTQSGEIIADYFGANPGADKNGDGTIQYILLKGEQGHQDATLRSEYAPKAITDRGYGVEELGSDNADWDKVKATDKMKGFISSIGIENIEAVLANNDDMALGAIEALKAEGYNTGDAAKYIPVVGVDATAPALEAMSEGTLLGTVLNDAVNQGNATVMIANCSALGLPLTEANVGYQLVDAAGTPSETGKYVWIDYIKVTAENYQDFM